MRAIAACRHGRHHGPALVAIVGLLIYALASNPKAAEIGRLLFFAGLLVASFVAAHEVVKL